MKLSVFSVLLSDQPLEQALAFLKSQGVQAVEIGCGGYPGKAHCDPAQLLADEEKLAAFKAAIDGSGLELAALSVHGNAVHPDHAGCGIYSDLVRAAMLDASARGMRGVESSTQVCCCCFFLKKTKLSISFRSKYCVQVDSGRLSCGEQKAVFSSCSAYGANRHDSSWQTVKKNYLLFICF